MNNELKSTAMDTAPKRWRKSISMPNGVEKSVCVKEIENGFIIELYKSWTEKSGEYKNFEKTYYSKDNPLKDMSPEVTEDFVDEFLNPSVKIL
jgi:hypothetical protein